VAEDVSSSTAPAVVDTKTDTKNSASSSSEAGKGSI
jgi:hypothetical protein